MCEGFFSKDAREWKRIRSLGWVILCGYADPQKAPESMLDWWPMEGDVKPKPESKRITKKRAAVLAKAIAAELERGR
ncbi:hypothetical protein [Pedobacter duraquae]|uniref:Uncharacterized protein n=1 Tax=Pedobacter duraquae TaxID=425511 RepID=A0A4R6IIT9_9SPHI|nr:hypothetical protein [Pedobacter duraquae]TDO21883.1 hypothetical protein CLV32_2991 [Pedobacter duraquae]